MIETFDSPEIIEMFGDEYRGRIDARMRWQARSAPGLRWDVDLITPIDAEQHPPMTRLLLLDAADRPISERLFLMAKRAGAGEPLGTDAGGLGASGPPRFDFRLMIGGHLSRYEPIAPFPMVTLSYRRGSGVPEVQELGLYRAAPICTPDCQSLAMIVTTRRSSTLWLGWDTGSVE